MKINKLKSMLLIGALTTFTMLSGCGNAKTSGADYVEGVLDVAYFAEDVNKSVSMSDDEIKAAREICKDKEAQFIESYFNMEDVSDETHKIFEDVAVKLCEAADYSVASDTDSVTVSIRPLKVYSEKLEEYVEDFVVKKYVEADKSCTEKEFADNVAKFMSDAAENPVYDEEVKVEVKVTKKGGKYSISDEDMSKIDAAMFMYAAE